eukprot:4343725-Amphidinium_carterae.4
MRSCLKHYASGCWSLIELSDIAVNHFKVCVNRRTSSPSAETASAAHAVSAMLQALIKPGQTLYAR